MKFIQHKNLKQYINPFILVVHYNVPIFRAVERAALRPSI